MKKKVGGVGWVLVKKVFRCFIFCLRAFSVHHKTETESVLVSHSLKFDKAFRVLQTNIKNIPEKNRQHWKQLRFWRVTWTDFQFGSKIHVRWLFSFVIWKKNRCDVIWRHVTSYDVMWRHVTSYDVTWRHMTSHDVTWRHVTSHFNMTSYDVTWRHVTS